MKTQLQVDQDEIMKKVDQQEQYLFSLMNDLNNKGEDKDRNRTYQFERAKLMGMVELIRKIGIDVQRFNWLYL